MAQLGHEYRRKRQFKRRYIPERSVRLLLYGHIGFRLMRIFFFRERSFRYLFI